MFRYANRWYTFHMEMISMVAIVVTAAFAIVSKDSDGASAAVAGLALANVFQTCTFIPYVMRLKADYMARFNSVERVAEYAYVS